jgi:hypothetical protein
LSQNYTEEGTFCALSQVRYPQNYRRRETRIYQRSQNLKPRVIYLGMLRDSGPIRDVKSVPVDPDVHVRIVDFLKMKRSI